MTKRNGQLQSLRGLAALCVLGGHAALILSTGTTVFLQQMFQPNAAVVLFYVLSGYVLTLSLSRDMSVGPFLVRRLFRIVPVYWAGVFVSCGSYLIADHGLIAGSTPWFNDTISGSAAAVQWTNIWPNLTVWTTSMSGVLWSVQVELFAAPLIPLMVYVSRRIPLFVDILIVAALAVVMRYLRASPLVERVPQLMFVAYLACFYLGVMLPRLIALARVRRIVGSGPLAAAVFAFSIYLYGHTQAFHIGFYGYLVACAFISAWLVAYGATGSSRLLSWPPCVRLGDISYSFYAYGTPILMPVALGIFLFLPLSWRTDPLGALAIVGAAFLGAAAITTPLAALSYRFIEQPGIRAGAAAARLFGDWTLHGALRLRGLRERRANDVTA